LLLGIVLAVPSGLFLIAAFNVTQPSISDLHNASWVELTFGEMFGVPVPLLFKASAIVVLIYGLLFILRALVDTIEGTANRRREGRES
jgi:hypothetical protein